MKTLIKTALTGAAAASAPPEEARNIPQAPTSLSAVIDRLEQDHDTSDLIETWISIKREQEIAPVNLRPHPQSRRHRGFGLDPERCEVRELRLLVGIDHPRLGCESSPQPSLGWL